MTNQNEGCAMTTYCVCCKAEILEKRARRGSHFCGDECRRAYRIARRQGLAERRCRLCGRTNRQQKQLDPVRLAHTISNGVVTNGPTAQN
jgi:hypothetical protein